MFISCHFSCMVSLFVVIFSLLDWRHETGIGSWLSGQLPGASNSRERQDITGIIGNIVLVTLRFSRCQKYFPALSYVETNFQNIRLKGRRIISESGKPTYFGRPCKQTFLSQLSTGNRLITYNGGDVWFLYMRTVCPLNHRLNHLKYRGLYCSDVQPF